MESLQRLKQANVMKTADEWDRFIRFMDRYAESHGLGLDQA